MQSIRCGGRQSGYMHLTLHFGTSGRVGGRQPGVILGVAAVHILDVRKAVPESRP
jgi:hypothetical protein